MPQQWAVVPKPAADTRDVLPLVVSLVAPVIAFILLLNGRQAIDRVTPDQGAAGAWLGACALLVLVAAACAGVLGRRAGLRLGIAGGVGVTMAALLASTIESSYGFRGLFGGAAPFYSWILLMEIAWLGIGIASIVTLVVHREGSQTGGDIAVAGGMGLTLALGGCAAYALATLPHQAQVAAQANRVPGLELPVLALLVIGGAWWLRRRAA